MKELRDIKGYKSDEEFAAAIGVKQSYISRWKNAKQGPSSESLRRIADSQNVSADWLIGRQMVTAGIDWAIIQSIAHVMSEDSKWKRKTLGEKLAAIAAVYPHIYALSKAGERPSTGGVMRTAIKASLQTGLG